MTEAEANARSLVKYFLTNRLTEFLGGTWASVPKEKKKWKSQEFFFFSLQDHNSDITLFEAGRDHCSESGLEKQRETLERRLKDKRKREQARFFAFSSLLFLSAKSF